MITVVRNFEANYPEDPIRFFNFEDYNEDTKDCILFIGAHPHNSISNPNNLPKYFLSTEDFLWIIGGGILLGCWICGQVSEELGRKDFGGIVWDEIIAFWIVLILIMPTNIWMQVFAFLLFRFFDAVKPGPIGMIDRHFKNNESKANTASSIPQILWRGFGIMVDDLAAAFFTLLIIALVQVFIR
jgi:phosphatidylglycerophosphatase A